MLKLEAILEEKAKKANQGLIIQGLYLTRLFLLGLNLLILNEKNVYIKLRFAKKGIVIEVGLCVITRVKRAGQI